MKTLILIAKYLPVGVARIEVQSITSSMNL